MLTFASAGPATTTMCYGVKARTEMALHIAKTRGDAEAVEKLKKLLHPYPHFDLHFANGFTHPQLVIYTDAAPHDPQLMHWGLVPGWVKDAHQADELQDRTLIARGETMCERPAFRHAAAHQRCLVFVEGYYEHHHFGKRTYPYFIHLKDRPQFALAGLWERWTDKATGAERLTFSIVTTAPNELMRRIHNNPKVKGPRMPAILTPEEEALWLAPGPIDTATIEALLKPYPDEAMTAHPVAPLLGREGRGNTAEASAEYFYPELVLADPLA
ncbi:MAG: SOS response-associated peptidase [Flavobacteriales bacterium]